MARIVALVVSVLAPPTKDAPPDLIAVKLLDELNFIVISFKSANDANVDLRIAASALCEGDQRLENSVLAQFRVAGIGFDDYFDPMKSARRFRCTTGTVSLS